MSKSVFYYPIVCLLLCAALNIHWKTMSSLTRTLKKSVFMNKLKGKRLRQKLLSNNCRLLLLIKITNQNKVVPFKMSLPEANKCTWGIMANKKDRLLMNNRTFGTSRSSFKYSYKEGVSKQKKKLGALNHFFYSFKYKKLQSRESIKYRGLFPLWSFQTSY